MNFLELFIFGILPMGLLAIPRVGVLLLFAYVAMLLSKGGDQAIANLVAYSVAVAVAAIVLMVVITPFRKS